MLVVLLLSVGGIVWLSQTSTLVTLGYDVERMKDAGAVLDTKAQVMQRQIADYTNPVRIEKEAREKLGMIPATQKVYLTVKSVTPSAPIATDASLADMRATQAANRTGNDKTAPVDRWWREMLEDLPEPYHSAAPPLPVTPTPAPTKNATPSTTPNAVTTPTATLTAKP